MRWVSLLVLLFASATVEAAPCDVTIARAPDEVRAEIESWVSAEKRCGPPLEVRVVPTDGGYYLFARDPAGHVRERIVPDAQSAGVLVASWVADDVASIAPLAAVPAMVLPPIAIVLEPAPQRDIGRQSGEPSRRASRWLTLGAMLRTEGGGGVGLRGELDLTTVGTWSLGVAFSGSEGYQELANLAASDWTDGFGGMILRDLRAVGTLARTSRFGAWELRLSGGVGLVRTTVEGFMHSTQQGNFTAEGVFPTAEGSALLSRRIGRHWAIGAGPVVTMYQENMNGLLLDETGLGSPMTVPIDVDRQAVEFMLFAGLRHEI